MKFQISQASAQSNQSLPSAPWVTKGSIFLNVNSEDYDQTELMPRLTLVSSRPIATLLNFFFQSRLGYMMYNVFIRHALMHELLGGSDLTHGMPCKMKLFLFNYFVILKIFLWKMGLQDPDPPFDLAYMEIPKRKIMHESRKNCQRGSNSDNVFVCVVLSWWRREYPNTTKSRQPSALPAKWRFSGRPMMAQPWMLV